MQRLQGRDFLVLVGELLLIRILRYLIMDDAAFVPRPPFARLPQQQGVAGDDG